MHATTVAGVRDVVCFLRVELGVAAEDELYKFVLSGLQDFAPFGLLVCSDKSSTLDGVQESLCSHVHGEGGIAWAP